REPDWVSRHAVDWFRDLVWRGDRQALTLLGNRLESPDEDLRAASLSEILALGPSHGADIAIFFVPNLMKVLRDESWSARRKAAFALEYIGPDAAAAVPALVNMLNDEQEECRSAAASALQQIDTEAAKRAGVTP